MKNLNRCVYCGSSDNLCKHPHVVPRNMGRFKNQPTLKNHVCQKCDTEIGKCEGQLIKCGIEAILRTKIRISGRTGNKSTSSLYRQRHYGYGPIQMRVPFPYLGWEVLVELAEDGENCNLLPQLVLISAAEKCHQILLIDPLKVNADELKKRIPIDQGQDWRRAWAVQLTDEETDHIFGLLKQLGMFRSEGVLQGIKPFRGKVRASGTTAYGEEYFRAIAKIAFHYFLVHSKLFDGSEPCFNLIRRFIRYGEGEKDSFLTQKKRPIAYDPSGADRPPYYGHVLRTEISANKLAVCVQLFIGRDYKPDYWEALLGPNPHRIFLPFEEFGHYYKYYEPKDRTKYDGTIEKISVASLIRPP